MRLHGLGLSLCDRDFTIGEKYEACRSKENHSHTVCGGN
jgi:hypothetical protein